MGDIGERERPPVVALEGGALGPNVIDAAWLKRQRPDSPLVHKLIREASHSVKDLSDIRASFRDQLVVVLSSLFVAGSFIWFPIVCYRLYRSCETKEQKRIFWFCVIAIVASLYFTNASRRARRWSLWGSWMRYLKMSLVVEELHKHYPPKKEDPPKIFASVPHGIYPFGQALSLTGGFVNVLGRLRPVTASAALHVPIFGHLLRLVDAVPATKEEVLKGLEERGDRPLLLLPGGIAEMFDAAPAAIQPKKGGAARKTSAQQTEGIAPPGSEAEGGIEVARVRGRKGFLRLAIQKGASVVPVFVFGNSRLWRLLPFGGSLLKRLSRTLRVSLVAFVGRWGLPVPLRYPVMTVVGRPLEVTKSEHPSEKEVDALSERFVEEIGRLFEEYKGFYGWGGRKLVVK